jgi:hypothetical protein
MPSAYFVVRATVTDPAKRKAFLVSKGASPRRDQIMGREAGMAALEHHRSLAASGDV